MGTNYAFSLVLVECIFDAVQREVELIKRKDYDPNFEEPSGSPNHLDHLVNLTAFQEVNRQAIIEQNQALVGWALAAYVWVAHIRKHCCEMNLTLKANDQSQASEVTDVDDTKLTEALEGLTRDISDLRDRVHSVEKIRNGLLGRNQEEQHQAIQHDGINFCYRPRSPAEEGEILEDIEFLDESQWESFEETKDYAASIISNFEASHNALSWHFSDIERKIFKLRPSPPQIEVTSDDIAKEVVAASKALARETDRLLVETEDKLLRFKATEYCRLVSHLEFIDQVISDIKFYVSKSKVPE